MHPVPHTTAINKINASGPIPNMMQMWNWKLKFDEIIYLRAWQFAWIVFIYTKKLSFFDTTCPSSAILHTHISLLSFFVFLFFLLHWFQNLYGIIIFCVKLKRDLLYVKCVYCISYKSEELAGIKLKMKNARKSKHDKDRNKMDEYLKNWTVHVWSLN